MSLCSGTTTASSYSLALNLNGLDAAGVASHESRWSRKTWSIELRKHKNVNFSLIGVTIQNKLTYECVLHPNFTHLTRND